MTSADKNMPSREWLFESALREYLARCTNRGLSKDTIRSYDITIRRVGERLMTAGLDVHPTKVGEREISYLLHSTPGNPDSIHQEIARFSGFLKFHDNHIMEKMGLRWQEGSRPNAAWLNHDQLETLWKEAEGWEEVILHLGFHIMMRKAEMMRICVQDFMGDKVRIMGKGRKIRILPYHPDTPKYLDLAIQLRQEAISKNWSGPIPGNLFLVSRNSGGKFGVRCRERSSMELIIAGLAKRTGVPFSFHTLRRTGGRHYWECDVPIETIAKMMGHKSIDMTLRYLGIEMDDMRKAMEMGQNGVSCGIRKIEVPVYRR